MSRTLPPWSHENHDAKVPDRVRLRIFEREGGVCYLSGRKIMPGEVWDLHHGQALINGGAHAEANLFPVLKKSHQEQTKLDVAEKAMVARKRKKFLGIKKPRSIRSWRKFDGTIVTKDRER